MKRIFAFLMSLVVCTTSLAVFASGSAVSDVDWRGNYSGGDAALTITVKSAVKYNQRVTAVLYAANVSAPSVNDFDRIAETEVKSGATKEITIRLGDDLTYEDENGKAHYKLRLKGSGTEAENINKTFDVYLLTPNKLPGILAAINAAQTTTAAKDALLPAIDALRVESGALTEEFLKYFLTSKKGDFSNRFATLGEVSEGLRVAEVLECLHGGSGVAQLKDLCEKYAPEMQIDTSDADYKAYTDSVFASLLRVKDTYKKNDADTAGIDSRADLKKAVAQYTAVAAINGESSSNSTAETTLAKYYSVLEIPNAEVTAFNAFSDDDKSKGLRVVIDTETPYTEPSEITKKFSEMVKKISEPGDNSEEGGPSGGAPSNGSSGGGGSFGITGVVPGGTAGGNTSTAAESFADCKAGHWAYTYVNELKKKNVINGYSDGTFRPDDTVTREEFVKMIISAVGLFNSAAECEFRDLNSNDWCYRYVASAVKEGIINGVSENRFGVSSCITREDTAVIAVRILERFEKRGETAEKAFSDFESISDYAAESVKTLSGMGILGGYEDGSFRPSEYVTRAEAAKIIYMIMMTV